VTEVAAAADTEPARRPVRLGSLPLSPSQDLRFVQDRIALFAKVTFLISTMFLVATTLAGLAAEVDRYSSISRACHVSGTLIALLIWRTTAARRTFAPSFLQAIDLGGTLAICVAFAGMGHFAIQPYGFYTGLLAATHVSVSRAMIVPSLPLSTLVLGVASFASFLVSRGVMALPPELPRGRGLLEAALWATAGIAVATLASHVIYGLQERARQARKLGQYTLEEKIGAGGMGEVYRARHAMLRRPTAVKLLTSDGSETQLRRFEKEVQLTARLTHPNTISIFDYGRTPDGVFYYAMELLDGLSLEELVLRHGPQPPGRVIHILLQVAGALREAHKVGLIHRDIKPANIHLCRRGDVPDVVKVLDFGLVRELKGSEDVTKSNLNAVVGTPLYLAPEAITAPDRVDGRADLYGLGGVAYYLATGATPFSGQNAVELCAHHLHRAPDPPSQRHPVPADLERVILACLEKRPDDRPASAEALVRELARCADAGSWSESDAEAFWSGAPGRAPEAMPPRSGERRRAAFVVDLEERFKNLDAYLSEVKADDRRPGDRRS